MALGLAQMVLDVHKNLKPTQFYMLNNLCFNNFPRTLITGDVRVQVLQESVSGSTLARAVNLECLLHFLTLGVKLDPIIPHTWGLGHPLQFPRGKLLQYIYKD